MSTTTRILSGIGAGTAATLVMSLGFGVAKRTGALPHLPPAIIVRAISPQFRRRRRNDVAALTHLAYGAAGGATYLAAVPAGLRSPVSGSFYGVLLWAIGYEGWVPFLGILPRAHRDAKPRAVSILLAHLLYGATLGWLARGSRR